MSELSVEQSLGLCVSDMLYSGNTPDKYRRVYPQYVQAGVRTLRLVPAWQSPEPGRYTLCEADEAQMRAAIAAGLRLKLVLSSVDVPPAWLYRNPATRFVDETGRYTRNNCVSYWYEGIYDYTRDAVSHELRFLAERGYLDSVDAIVVACGPACEPIYPADWTQLGIPGMWCYGENAVADFRRHIAAKYGTIASANRAWGTRYARLDDLCPPRPGEADGPLWEDVLVWYRDVKRDFVIRQTTVYQEEVRRFCEDRVRLILYMPGDAYTGSQWRAALRSSRDTATSLKIMSENEFIVQTAARFGTLLQFTGMPMTAPVKRVLHFMYENGYGHIPVYGENTNDRGHASDPAAFIRLACALNLAGIDYTTSQFLFEGDDYITPAKTYRALMESMPRLDAFLRRRTMQTPALVAAVPPRPGQRLLCFTLCAAGAGRYSHALFAPELTLQAGDLLEYDLCLPAASSGLGQIDLRFSDGLVCSAENDWICDERGIRSFDTDLRELQGRWAHRRLAVGIDESFVPRMFTAGAVLRTVGLLSHVDGAGEYTLYLDNLVITRGGQERCVIFRNGAGLPLLPLENARAKIIENGREMS